MSGTLFVVATPIGNLEDLTFRALRTLREVDLIAAEDTRRTAKLLAHYEIRRPLVSLHEHNEAREAPRLIARLAAGASIALVSDAGTPGIADPGATLVGLARRAGITVAAIPGPNAIATALSASGLQASEFAFMGFAPSSGSSRRDWLLRVSDERRAVVLFEAPHRIHRLIGELNAIMGNRTIIIHRELTKTHEECVISPITTEVAALGEFTIVLGPSVSPTGPGESLAIKPNISEAYGLWSRLVNGAEFDEDVAIATVAHLLSVSAASARNLIKKGRFLAKQQSM